MSFRSEKITLAHCVWNQDKVQQNSREAKRFCNMSLHSAQTMLNFFGSGHLFAVIFIPCMTLYSPSFTLYFALDF